MSLNDYNHLFRTLVTSLYIKAPDSSASWLWAGEFKARTSAARQHGREFDALWLKSAAGVPAV
jgi:hypothetical protein